jgi:hypothetical protein
MPIPGRPAKECPPLPWPAAVTSGAVSVVAKRQLKKITSFELFIGGRVSKHWTSTGSRKLRFPDRRAAPEK